MSPLARGVSRIPLPGTVWRRNGRGCGARMRGEDRGLLVGGVATQAARDAELLAAVALVKAVAGGTFGAGKAYHPRTSPSARAAGERHPHWRGPAVSLLPPRRPGDLASATGPGALAPRPRRTAAGPLADGADLWDIGS